MANIYLFKGNEELIIHNKIEIIIRGIKIPSFNRTTYDLEVSSLSDAVNDCLTIPLMGDGKVVIIRNPHFLEKGNKDTPASAIKSFIAYLHKPNEDCTLIVDATGINIDEKNEAAIVLDRVAEVSDTKNLSEVEMKGWLKSRFVRRGIDITPDAIDLFFSYVGTNLIKGSQEVDKLINFLGERKNVTVSDIENVVTDDGETDVFALTNAINQKDKALVHKKYHELIKNGYDPIQLLSLIYKTFKDMYTVLMLLESGAKQNDIASMMNVSSGRAYYLMKDASKFNLESIKKNLYNITELDYKIKTGQIDKATGMDLLLFGM